jgi:hypothetical protein
MIAAWMFQAIRTGGLLFWRAYGSVLEVSKIRLRHLMTSLTSFLHRERLCFYGLVIHKDMSISLPVTEYDYGHGHGHGYDHGHGHGHAMRVTVMVSP